MCIAWVGRQAARRNPYAVDCGAARILPAGTRPQPRVPRQVRGRAAGASRGGQTGVPRPTGDAGSPGCVCRHAADAVPQGMGGVCQASIPRGRARAPLSGLLHAPRGHLQSSAGRAGRWRGGLPLARLGAPQQEAADAAGSGRVPAAVLSACLAKGLCAHPALRILRPPAARCIAAAGFRTAEGEGRAATCFRRFGNRKAAAALDVPALWRPDGACREIHGRRSAIARPAASGRETMPCSLTTRMAPAWRRPHSDCVRYPRQRHPMTYRSPQLCIRRVPDVAQPHDVKLSAAIQNT